jgi:hypothetical protein
VPIGYLITAVLLGACTLAALWPFPCRSAVGTVVYLVSMTFNELPAPALLWAVAATLLAVADGDLATPLGVAAAVLMAVVAAGLLLVTWRAVRSRAVPERSLDDALGTRWRADIAPHLAAGLRTHPRSSAVCCCRSSGAVATSGGYATSTTATAVGTTGWTCSCPAADPQTVRSSSTSTAAGSSPERRTGSRCTSSTDSPPAAGRASAPTTASRRRPASPTTWWTPSGCWPGCGRTVRPTG